MSSPLYLYLTTTGRRTGNPHQIEIWFVETGGCFYLISEFPDRADWVRNIVKTPAAVIRVGSRDAQPVAVTGRLVQRDTEPELAQTVARLMQDKYNWSDGQIVELKPAQ